jgi:hypothetical protein
MFLTFYKISIYNRVIKEKKKATQILTHYKQVNKNKNKNKNKINKQQNKLSKKEKEKKATQILTS